MALEINEVLNPGDLIEVQYEIRNAPETLTKLAIHKVKTELWADPRFNYQGSRIDEVTDAATGEKRRYLFIQVQVRRYLKGDRIRKVQASAFHPTVLLGVIAAAITAVAVSSSLAYQNYTILRSAQITAEEAEKIRTDPSLSAEQKTQILSELYTEPPAAKSVGVGTGLAALGGSVVTAAIVIGVLWALSLSGRPRGIEA